MAAENASCAASSASSKLATPGPLRRRIKVATIRPPFFAVNLLNPGVHHWLGQDLRKSVTDLELHSFRMQLQMQMGKRPAMDCGRFRGNTHLFRWPDHKGRTSIEPFRAEGMRAAMAVA